MRVYVCVCLREKLAFESACVRGVGARGVAPPAGRASWLLTPAYAAGIHRKASPLPGALEPATSGREVVAGEEGTSR